MKKSTLNTVIAAAMLAGGSFAANADPIPLESTITLDFGSGAPGVECTAGSCFGMEVQDNFWIWTNITSGTDGGFIVGKNQASGGQEDGSANVDGELSAIWNFFGNDGTFYTPTGSTNIFSDTSCSDAGCIGKTELNSFNVAWNNVNVPMGAGDGCNSPKCTADQLAGIFITEWTTTDNGDGSYGYVMRYGNRVPDGDPSNFGNVNFQLIARGTIYTPVPAAVWLFGSGLVALAGIARRRKAVV